MHILLIDDEPIIHQSLGSFLQRAGHEVHSAVNGHEGLLIAAEEPPDLVISDIKMPGLNGLELLDRLKMRAPATPVILITGHGDVDTAIAALDKGAYSYLRKPIKLDELVEVVQRIDQRRNFETSLLRDRTRLTQPYNPASMGQFAAGIAHEINNPNTMIRGNLQTFAHIWERLEPSLRRCADEGLSTDLIDEIPGLIHSMQRGTDRIKQIVEQIQHFTDSNHQSGSEIDLRQCLNSALNALSLPPQQLELTDQAATPCPIRAAPPDLIRVFTHLLNNAADAISQSPDGKISLSIETEDEAWVKVSIADNGPGIEASIATHIFDPFFTTKDPGRGTGMGLAICHYVISELGGNIDFQSKPGQGAHFWIRLPLACAETAIASA